jgi:hypothetical protein
MIINSNSNLPLLTEYHIFVVSAIFPVTVLLSFADTRSSGLFRIIANKTTNPFNLSTNRDNACTVTIYAQSTLNRSYRKCRSTFRDRCTFGSAQTRCVRALTVARDPLLLIARFITVLYRLSAVT